jgi:hypothetical protein
MTDPRPAVLASKIRYRVDPGDIPEEKAARRLGLSVDQFREKLPRLLLRQFPKPDPDTGLFDLDAIDLWRRSRNPVLYGLTPLQPDHQPESSQSMGDRFVEAKERRRHDPTA